MRPGCGRPGRHDESRAELAAGPRQCSYAHCFVCRSPRHLPDPVSDLDPVGYPKIEGVQGRYLLPLLLAGLFALPIRPARLSPVGPFAAAAAIMATGVVTLIWPELVVRYFYVS